MKRTGTRLILSNEGASEPEGWVDGAPTSSEGRRCAFCRDKQVLWVHPLDSDKTAYRAWGKGRTLPGSWSLCDRCEQLHQRGEYEEIVQLMMASSWDPDVDEYEEIRKPLEIFVAADRGARRFES